MKIFCGNLAYVLSEAELRAAFEEHGEVTGARIVCDFESDRPRGFGFVEMPNEDSALRAIAALSGKELRGRPLRCRRAYERPMRPLDNV